MPEETEEEFKARLRTISDEVKADMVAGRYRHGQLHPEIHAKKQQIKDNNFLGGYYGIETHEEHTSSAAVRDAWKEDLIDLLLDRDTKDMLQDHMRRSLMMPDYGNPYWPPIMPSSKEYYSTKETKARETLRWKRGDFYDID